jgi:hypothetical protein
LVRTPVRVTKEEAMDGRGGTRRRAVAGLGTIALAIACAVAWIVGWNTVAAVAGLGAFAVGATVAGTDSRVRGDWTVPGRS